MKKINIDENGVVEICDEKLLTAVAGGYGFEPTDGFVIDKTVINAGFVDLSEVADTVTNVCPETNAAGCKANGVCGDEKSYLDLVLPVYNELY